MFTIAVAFLCTTAQVEQPPVTFVSACECRTNHGKGRWAIKNGPPTEASVVQSVTPSELYG